MPIPSDITREDVLDALGRLDAGATLDYGQPTKYQLVHGTRRYAPKAAIGLAAGRTLGRPLSSREFSGGQASTQANARLRALGFLIVPLLSPGNALAPGRSSANRPPRREDWSIKPGDRVRRQDLQAAYGGAPRGGIEPSAQSPNVLIFSEPEKVHKHSYGFDGWAGATLLHYTGEGPSGDQRFVDGNRAILEHRQQGRALRVFRAQPPWATYLGQFEIDRATPFYLADSPGTDGLIRQVIVFRLRPIGKFVDGGLGAAPRAPRRGVTQVAGNLGDIDAPSSVDIPTEATNVPSYVVSPPAEPTEYLRREAALVRRYADWLHDRGRTYGRQRIGIPGELSALYTDLYDNSLEELIEAKATSSRNSIRVGLGQLLDYARFVVHDRRSLLVPAVPRPDLLELLRLYGCGCIWETSRGQFERFDP